MRTLYADNCLKCLFVDLGSNCGLTHVDCRLEDGRSCVNDSRLGPGGCFVPDRIEPPDWCPLPVCVKRLESPDKE